MLRAILLAALAGVATPAVAAKEQPSSPIDLTGTATLASDYRFRGISLSGHGPALQGSLTATHRSGLYATAWASNIDGFGELGGSNLEVDLSAGYRSSRGDTTYDAGLVYYAYPGSSGGTFEFFEPYASVSHQRGRVAAKVGVAFAPAQAAIGARSNIYVAGDLNIGIKDAPLTFKAHVGLSEGDTTLSPGGGYTDWSAGAETAWRGVNVGLAYIDTNINKSGARRVGARPRDVGASFIASATIGF